MILFWFDGSGDKSMFKTVKLNQVITISNTCSTVPPETEALLHLLCHQIMV